MGRTGRKKVKELAKEHICMTHRHRQGTMEWVMDGLRAEGRGSWVEVGKGGKVVTTVIM